ncbi:hypothetical protein TNCV_991721 [Trichonephila clavipes]|nr:hypothetical protein TNCV_991721 [Trichonephila clavipes]
MSDLRVTFFQTTDSWSLQGQFPVAPFVLAEVDLRPARRVSSLLINPLLSLIRWWLRRQHPLESGLCGKSYIYYKRERGRVLAHCCSHWSESNDCHTSTDSLALGGHIEYHERSQRHPSANALGDRRIVKSAV